MEVKPLVSVLITSYNKSDMIQKAIDSVLMQVTKYPFKVIVLEDGSTDETHKSLEKYSNDNRVFIHWFKHRGLAESITQGIYESETKYTAVLGADDFWTDKYKLETQLEYMESNDDCGLCFTNGTFITPTKEYRMINCIPDTTFNGLLSKTNFVCASMLFRSNIIKQHMPKEKFVTFLSYDYPLILLYAKFSRIHYNPLPSITSLLTVNESLTRSHKRLKRLKLITYKFTVIWYFISRYGCKIKTLLYLIYRFTRDIYSVIFKRWYK